jgi:heat shock protein 90kDa beta
MTRKKQDVPEEDEEAAEVPAVTSDATEESDVVEKDDEEAVVEDVSTDEAAKAEDIPKKTKTVVVEEWSRVNSQPPLWTRYVQNIDSQGNCCSARHFLGIPRT